MQEFRTFGPPGTGKTTLMATQMIPKAVEKYGPNKVLISSFTRTAAKEIATKKSLVTGKPIDINPKNVGTMHSLCFHALDSPDLTVGRMKDWNAENFNYQISGSDGGSVDEGGSETSSGASNGAQLLGKLNILRSRMVPENFWPQSVRAFNTKWKAWKDDHFLMDFTDLIEESINRKPIAPNNPDVLFIDEAQDFTPLQFKLARLWGQNMEWYVLIGDDDQAIFSFTGASPDAFLNPPVENKFKRVLSQSYRVPKAVFERADRLIRRVSRREPKEYKPRDFEGCVRQHDGNFKNVEGIINDVKKQLKTGKTVMLLASCAYMLDQLKEVLKKQGIPFHNPYRVTRGDWNPLKHGTEKTVTTVDMINNFIGTGPDGKYWTIQQLIKWAKSIKTGDTGLKRKQGKAGLKALQEAVEADAGGLDTSREVIGQLFNAEAIEPIMNRDLEWLNAHLVETKRKNIKFPLAVLDSFGPQALIDRPPVIIGTIHSVKGGEADVVYLFPDLSIQAMMEMQKSREAVDSIYRLFYVGMTRAREELVITSPILSKRKGLPSLFMEM